MYYTTLETYKKKYQHRSLTHAYSAKTKEEHEVWKKSLRDRLWEITGMNKCVYCEPDAQYLRTDCVNELIAALKNMALNKEVQYSARFSGGNCRRVGQCRLFSGRKNGFTF